MKNLLSAALVVGLLVGVAKAQPITGGSLPPGGGTNGVALTPASVTASGAISAASLSATGLVSGATVSATGNINAGTLSATGGITGSSLTLTATSGNYFAAGATATLTTAGIWNLGSQPHTCLQQSAQRPYASGVATTQFWDVALFNQQNMWLVASSSTIKIPVGGAGLYRVTAQTPITHSATGTYWELDTQKNGSGRVCTASQAISLSASTNAQNLPWVDCDMSLAAGDTVGIILTTDGAAGNSGLDQLTTQFCVRKY